MSECVFCAIARGTLAASVIHRSERCLAFMDVHPISRGHALVVPLAHQARLGDVDAPSRAEMFELAYRVLDGQRRCGLAGEGANLLLNDGAAANQHIAHVHLHIVPRRRGDRPRIAARFVGRLFNAFGGRARRAELDALAAGIREHLPA